MGGLRLEGRVGWRKLNFCCNILIRDCLVAVNYIIYNYFIVNFEQKILWYAFFRMNLYDIYKLCNFNYIFPFYALMSLGINLSL